MADHTLGNVMCAIMSHMGVKDFFSESTVKGICYAGKRMHTYLFSYLEQFIGGYHVRHINTTCLRENKLEQDLSKPTISVLKTNEAHERSYSRVAQLDNDLELFLQSVPPETTVVLMGDHGIGTIFS